MKWAMVIDLKLCVGCNACVIACKAANGTPPGIFWTRILEQEVGTYPAARRIFMSMRCMHCENPPCMEVCPTKATHQREDKLVMVDHEKCIGCKACILACPYNVRFHWEGQKGYFEQQLTPYEEKAYTAHTAGTVQKCDFCADRIDQGQQPHCVETCLTSCLIFGDLDDPESQVSQCLRSARSYFRLKEEQGTGPSIYYLNF